MNKTPKFDTIVDQLIPGDSSRGIAGVHFELVPSGDCSDFLRHRDRPDDLYGFRLEYSAQGDSHALSLVGMARSEQLYPHTRIRRATLFDRFRRNQVRTGDNLFDRRWIIISDDRRFAEALSSASMCLWLLSIAAERSTVEFEINLRFVVAVERGRRIDRLPSVIQTAHEFVCRLPRWTQ